MANVTFIIGNGLDLSLGLKTSYRDFYEYVQSQGLHPENRIYKAIKESPESWSDFESSLAQYTNYIEKAIPEKDKKAESLKFHDELADLTDDLATYLAAQEAGLASLDGVELAASGFYRELPQGQASRISNTIQQGSTVSFQFVTLNYTRTIDTIIKNSRQSLMRNSVNVGELLHIHGDLKESLTLGISGESQLPPGLSGAEREDLIKPASIYSMNDGRMEMMHSLVGNCSIIVLFGTSIGESDEYIWQMVIEWLTASSARFLIIHQYNPDYTPSIQLQPRRHRQFNSHVQEKLLRYSGLDGDGIANLASRIFIVHNTEDFFRR